MEYLASDSPTLTLPNIVDGFRTTKRNSAPIPLRSRVLMDIPGGHILRGQTIDIGKNSLNVTLPSRLVSGLECSVFFNITVAEKTYVIIGAGRVVNCTSSPTNGYCAKLSFTIKDEKAREAVEQLLNTPSNECLQ